MSQGPLPFYSAQNPLKVPAPQHLDAQGAQYVVERHGSSFGATYNGNIYWGANQAGVTTSAGLATTYVGICLSNPAGSGKNLAIGKVSAYLTVAPAVLGVGLIVGYAAAGVVTHTTPLTVYSDLIGATASAPNGTLVGTPVGLVDGACTIVGTPLWRQPLGVGLVSANLLSVWEDMNGSIILPPGAYLAIGTNVAGPTSGFWGSIQWEENPQ
jgi:hypothetical protein